MTENIQLEIIYDERDGTLEKKINVFMKGKNILATQVLDSKVWIWYKTTRDEGFDGFHITE